MQLELDRRDIDESLGLLQEAAQMALSLEGHMGATRTSLGPAAEALQGLAESRTWFGDPRANFWRIPTADESGRHFLVKVPLALQPRRGATFSRVECQLDLAIEGEHAGPGPELIAVFPEHRFRSVLKFTRHARLGVDESLRWKMKLPVPSPDDLEMPAALRAEVEANAQGALAFELPSYAYELGTADIVSIGVGPRAFWRVDAPGLHQQAKIEFVALFKVPSETSAIELKVTAAAFPQMGWLTSRLVDVIDFLSERFQALFRRGPDETSQSPRLPIGSVDTWTLHPEAAAQRTP